MGVQFKYFFKGTWFYYLYSGPLTYALLLALNLRIFIGIMVRFTVQKVSVFGVILRTRITLNMDTFHVVIASCY